MVNVPATHCVQADTGPTLYAPDSQPTHVTPSMEYVPALHALHAVAFAPPGLVQPTGHASHGVVRFVMLENVPALQYTHAVWVNSSSTVKKDPAGHGMQGRVGLSVKNPGRHR